MRQNSGEAFFHPVTHQLIEKNGFYHGAAHLEHEIETEEVEQKVEEKEEKLDKKDKTSKKENEDK